MTTVLSRPSLWCLGSGAILTVLCLVLYLGVVEPKLTEYQSATVQFNLGLSELFGRRSVASDYAASVQALQNERLACFAGMGMGGLLVVVGLALPRRTVLLDNP